MYRHGGDIYSYQNVIDYSANVNFLGMPESVRQAAQEGIARSVHYPDVQCRKLREALSKREQVLPEHIYCANGAAEIFFSLALAKMPRQALLPVPAFELYSRALSSVKCRIHTFELRERDGFALKEEILSQITEEIDILFVCNPNNPTGEVVEPELMRRILRRCETTGTLLVADECFNEFLDDPKRYTLLPFVEKSENLFLVRSLTKMYALPGLRLGYGLCCNGALLDRMERVSQPWRVSVPAQAAGVAAAAEVEFAQESGRRILEEKEKMAAAMRDMGYQIYGSRANYIFFEGEHYLAKEMLAKGFLIRDCGNYQGLHAGFYRVAVRGKKDNEAFLAALSAAHCAGQAGG